MRRCGWCKKLTPDWVELAKKVDAEKKDFSVGEIDCEASAATCKRFGVSSYPTIKLVRGGMVNIQFFLLFRKNSLIHSKKLLKGV